MSETQQTIEAKIVAADEANHTIDRNLLLRELKRAAQVRAFITLGFGVAVGLFLHSQFPVIDQHPFLSAILLFGVPGCVATKLLCTKMVICPHCGGSLWQCGSGSFKAGRMRVVASRCTHCMARIA